MTDYKKLIEAATNSGASKYYESTHQFYFQGSELPNKLLLKCIEVLEDLRGLQFSNGLAEKAEKTLIEIKQALTEAANDPTN